MGRLCDCIVKLDKNFVILDLNPKLASLLLRPPEDLVDVTFETMVAEEDRDMVRSTFSQEVFTFNAKSGERKHVLELSLLNVSEEKVKVRVYWSEAKNLQGDAVYILGISEDSKHPHEDALPSTFDQAFSFNHNALGCIPETESSSASVCSDQWHTTAGRIPTLGLLANIAGLPIAFVNAECALFGPVRPRPDRLVLFRRWFAKRSEAHAFQAWVTGLLEHLIVKGLHTVAWPVTSSYGKVTLKPPIRQTKFKAKLRVIIDHCDEEMLKSEDFSFRVQILARPEETRLQQIEAPMEIDDTSNELSSSDEVSIEEAFPLSVQTTVATSRS